MGKPARGYEPRDFKSFPMGSSAFEQKWDERAMPLMSMKEAAEKCRDDAAKGIDPLGMAMKRNAMPTYQNGYGYCWFHAMTMLVKLCFAQSGQPIPRLSATAGAAKIKRYANRGGNAFEAFPFAAEHGIPTVEFWPENKVERSLDTQEMQDNAKLHRVLEWYVLPPRSDEHKWTALANRFAVWTGYSNIGHAMAAARFRLDSRGNPTSDDINSHSKSAANATRWEESWLGQQSVVWVRGGRNFTCFEQYAIRTTTIAA